MLVSLGFFARIGLRVLFSVTTMLFATGLNDDGLCNP